MGTKLEIFECSVYIISVEINCFRPKTIYSCFQMDNMNIVDITSFEVNEGKNRVKLFTGTQFIARISCLEAFQTCPIYVYFTNAQNQTICACGFDMSPLIVDAFKSSSPENNNPITYREKLYLQNRYDQQVGVGIFEFSCRHFSQDLSIIQNFVEEVKPSQETNVITEQPQLEENTRANAMVMARSTRRKYEMPIMKDLLVLTKKYQKSSNGLVDEVEVLENEVRMIEKRQNMILQKKNQEQRRKIDIHQPLIPDTSSTHTSDFSYFENSSDYSYNSIMNQTFKDVEKTCGRSFSHHKTHHNRHKEHHHHHHHKKETNEPENEVKQENEVKHENQAQISAKSSKISQSDFDAFMQRQNAATERRRSFIQLNESISFTSQASQASSKKLQRQKPSSSQQQQQQQQQQKQQTKAPEVTQEQIVGSQKQQKPNQEQPTAQTTKPNKIEKSDETSKQEQNQQKQENKPAKKEEKQDQSSSEIEKPKEEITSSRISSARSAASSKSSRSSSHIEPVSTVETLEIPSDDSKSSVKSKSSAKSNKSKNSDTSRISASSKASNSSKTSRASNSSKTSRTSNSSRVSSSSKVSKSSKKSVSSSRHSSFEAETIEEPTTSNIIDVEQSSHIDVESNQKLSFTGTQETLDIDDDDVVDVEQKSSTTTPSATATTTATKNSASTKNKTKESKTSSGVEFSNDLSKNDTQNISPSDSEMNGKDEHNSMTESFISKKSNSDEEFKKKNNLDDIDLSELIDGLNDPSAGNSSTASDLKNDSGFDSELKNALGIESESMIGEESKKKEKKEKSPPPEPESEPEEKEEKEEVKPSITKEQISELQSGIDIDDIFSD